MSDEEKKVTKEAEDDFEQADIDDFSFISSNQADVNEDSEHDELHLSEDEASSGRFKRERKGGKTEGQKKRRTTIVKDEDEDEDEEFDSKERKEEKNNSKSSREKRDHLEKEKSKQKHRGRDLNRDKESRSRSSSRSQSRSRSRERNSSKKNHNDWDSWTPSSKEKDKSEREREREKQRDREKKELERERERERREKEALQLTLKARNVSKFSETLLAKSPIETKQSEALSDQIDSEQNSATTPQPRYRDYSRFGTRSSEKRENNNNFKDQYNGSRNTDSPYKGSYNKPNNYGNSNYSNNSNGSVDSWSTQSSQYDYTQQPNIGAPPPPGGSILPGVDLNLSSIQVQMPFVPTTEGKAKSQLPRTTIDPNMKVPENLAQLEARRIAFKNLASTTIIGKLSKYFQSGKIATKDDFKHLSRKLTHKIMQKEEGKFIITPKTVKKIQKLVDSFFEKQGERVYGRSKQL